jgi:ribosome-binding factor A
MHPRRLVRLNELILQTVSQAVLNLKDPEIGFVTITGGELTPDVSLVKIYYSVLGDPATRDTTAKALERARTHIRHEVGQLENLRRVPNLLFIYDDSVERADRVNRILHTIHEEEKPAEPLAPLMETPSDKKPRRKKALRKKTNARRN